jgi:MFS family permease
MLPMAAIMVVIAPQAPRLVERVGTKIVVGGGLVVVVAGLLVLTRIPVTNGYPHLLLGFSFVAIGMALTTAPATESILGSLPPAKAGVGSAMNDTTRQMGGALGVAILGSAFATIYRPGIAGRLSGMGLSAEQLSRAKDSVGGALQVASDGVPASTAQRIVDAARSEFVDGMHLAILVAAVVVLLAVVVVFAFLPARAVDHAHEPTGEPVPVDPDLLLAMDGDVTSVGTP